MVTFITGLMQYNVRFAFLIVRSQMLTVADAT